MSSTTTTITHPDGTAISCTTTTSGGSPDILAGCTFL
jgi:hypothetical protein